MADDPLDLPDGWEAYEYDPETDEAPEGDPAYICDGVEDEDG